MIKKSPDSDPTAPKSYRPISLLPVLGKGFERIICARIIEETSQRMNQNQFGFTKGKTTIDAIKNIIGWHNTRAEKDKVFVLLDISGAFDNLQWSVLHEDIITLGCSDYIRAITKNYLCRRTATLNYGGFRQTVTLTKRCPQGSIFGPVLWNITINRLFDVNLPEYAHIQAYADDIAVSAAANTRTQLVSRASEILEIVKIGETKGN